VDKALDIDEVTSQPGGFADDEDIYSITADREEVVNLSKSSRRSATVRTTVLVALWFSCSYIFRISRPRFRLLTVLNLRNRR
jgi:hypothetical protein